MFFSIIIPVYNVEKYLCQCVDSILAQSFKDYELILVDDGAKDNSGKICDQYAEKDERIRVIHKPNGGAADSRNVGTQVAQGEYIIYIDSDDYIDRATFLEELYEKAQSGADIICYKFKKYFENSGEFGNCSFKIPDLEKCDTMADKLKALVSNDAFYCSPWSKTIKNSLLKENGIEFEKGLLGEDQDWYYRVILSAKSIDGIDEDYIVYRQTANSTSRSWKTKNLTDCLGIIQKWTGKMQTSNLDDELKYAIFASLAKLYCNLLIGYTNFKSKEKKAHYKELRELSYLLKYDLNPRTKTFNKIKRLCGFRLMMTFLKVLCKVRSK